MSEGQLKKRILKVVEGQIGKTTISYLLTKDVVDWIDEAKEEYPKQDYGYSAFDDLTVKSARQQLEKLFRQIEQRDDWFLKWIGDQNGE